MGLPMSGNVTNMDTGTFTVFGTGGNFTLSYSGQTTPAIAVGAAPSAVATALTNIMPTGQSAAMTQSGNTYSVTLSGGGHDMNHLSGQIILTGTVARTSTASDFASKLQSSIAQAL